MKEQNQRIKLDEIMKYLFTVSKKVLINMMNTLFNENFNADMIDVTFESNEFVLNELDIIRGDLFLKIIQNDKPYHYHIELQTLNDATMVIRLFEYGFTKAKELAKLEGSDETIIYIPKQLVIFVEQNKNIKNSLMMRLIFPDGQEVQYTVPVMKYWEYDDQHIINQKLYPLLPLQVFKLRYKMENIKRKQGNNADELKRAVQEAKHVAEAIAIEGKQLYDDQELTADDFEKILVSISNLFEYLNKKYVNDKSLDKEVRKMTKTLYDPVVEARGMEKGIERGMEKGIEKGIEKDKLEVARAALLEGATVEFVSKITKLDIAVVTRIQSELSVN